MTCTPSCPHLPFLLLQPTQQPVPELGASPWASPQQAGLWCLQHNHEQESTHPSPRDVRLGVPRLPWPSPGSEDTPGSSAGGAGERIGTEHSLEQRWLGGEGAGARAQLGIYFFNFAFLTGEMSKKSVGTGDLPTLRISSGLQKASGFTSHLLRDVFYCPSTGQMSHLPINQQKLSKTRNKNPLRHVSEHVRWITMIERKFLPFPTPASYWSSWIQAENTDSRTAFAVLRSRAPASSH